MSSTSGSQRNTKKKYFKKIIQQARNVYKFFEMRKTIENKSAKKRSNVQISISSDITVGR